MEDNNIQQEQAIKGQYRPKLVSPIIDIDKPIKRGNKELEDIKKTSPRIPYSLSTNLAASRTQDLFTLTAQRLGIDGIKKVVTNVEIFQNLVTDESIKEILSLDMEKGTDRKGKPLYYNNKETRVIYALCFIMSQYLEDEDIKTFLEEKKSPEQEVRDNARPIVRTLSLTNITKVVYDGSSRDREKADVLEAISSISSRKQVHRFDIHFKDTDTGKDSVVTLLESGNIITANIKAVIKKSENNTPVIEGDNIILTFLSPIFFEGGYFTPLTKRLFSSKVWNRTEIFSTLLNILTEKYPQYTNHAEGMEKGIKHKAKLEGRINKEQIEEEVKENTLEQLSCPISFKNIKSRTPIDYTKKQYKPRFIPELRKALNSLINWGVITEESQIDESREVVIAVYNMRFRRDRLTETFQDIKDIEEE